MNRTQRAAAIGALVLLPSLFLGDTGWMVMPSPNLGATNYLNGVSALSASDIWAAGYAYTQSASFAFALQVTLLEHWDGASWTRVPSPNPGTPQRCGAPRYTGNALWSVAAISSTDVWAVGQICTWSTFQTLTEHWDGSAWTVVPSPNQPRADSSVLTAVVALASDNVWAAGDFEPQGKYITEPLFEHWDGTQWSIVSSPGPANASNVLNGIAATSANDLWAVGYSQLKPSYREVPLIEHYDGGGWSVVASPFAAQSLYNGLYGVTAVSPNDVWAVGYQNENSQGQNGAGLIEHWDGTSWSLVDSPIAGSATSLTGIAATGSQDVWAVGYITTANIQWIPVTEHWDGSAWTVERPPNPGKVGQLLGAAAAAGHIWSAGAYSTAMSGGSLKDPRTLILEH
jgi:hypothetical protein